MRFSTEVKWKTDRKMELRTSNGVELNAGPPPEFGGYKNILTAEESFVGSINLCWVSTLLAMKEKLGVKLRSVECKAIGTVERPEKSYKFTKIDLYPKIEVDENVTKVQLDRLLDLSHRYCLVTQSVNSEVTIHPEIKKLSEG
jgi:organic hydroperoxide reductase OsmC/OhrA